MTKIQRYLYKEGEVTLDFSFEENLSILKNKNDFVVILEKALEDLNLELKNEIN